MFYDIGWIETEISKISKEKMFEGKVKDLLYYMNSLIYDSFHFYKY